MSEAQDKMNQAILARVAGSERFPVAWVIQLGKDEVQFARVIKGGIDEDYAPVGRSTANVYASAILNDLEPPRYLHPCDKPFD